MLVTIGNGTGTKIIFKWNRALGFEFSIQSSVYCSKSKPILYLDTVYCKFLPYVSLEIDPFSCEQTSGIYTKTNFLYLGLVNVTVITGTCCS